MTYFQARDLLDDAAAVKAADRRTLSMSLRAMADEIMTPADVLRLKRIAFAILTVA